MNEILKKLNFKSGRVWVLGAPKDLDPLIDLWKADAEITTLAQPEAVQRFGIIFLENENTARSLGFAAVPSITDDGIIWFAYPKKTSKKFKSDLNRDKLWDIVKEIGLTPVRQVALDDDWSALRFKREPQT